jgi:hypothetical protein
VYLECNFATSDTEVLSWPFHSLHNIYAYCSLGHPVGHCATSGKVAGSVPISVIEIFHWDNTSGPGVDSASNRNKYQEYFLAGGGVGVKAASSQGWQLCRLLMCRLSWNLGASTSWKS